MILKRLISLGLFLALPLTAHCAGGFNFPDAAAATTRGSRPAIAVLETLSGRVSIVSPSGSDASALPGVRSPIALAGDETGLVVVLGASGGGFTLSAFRDGRPEGRENPLEWPDKGRASGLAVRNGIVWVTFREPAAVALFGLDGKLLSRADHKQNLEKPFCVALMEDGRALVTDPMTGRVVAFTPSGDFLARFDLAGKGMVRPTGIAVGMGGKIFVSDGITGMVGVLNITSGGVELLRSKKFDDPKGLFADNSVGGRIWIVESKRGRVIPLEE